jgi:hypothetical protein
MTKEHIIYTLGINPSLLTESLNTNQNITQLILKEQMLYESFIDSIKKYAQDKWDKTLTTLKDWKDAAVAIGKLISSGDISNLIGPVFRYGIKQPLKNLKGLLDKAGLGKFYTDNVIPVINKIGQLDGWKGFVVTLSIGGILKYITSKLNSLSAEGLKKWIIAYFSDEAIENIISKLTDFSTFIGWLQPIIKGTEIVFDILKPSLERLNRPDIQISESKYINIYNKLNLNKMKNEVLKKLIKEEILNLIKEEAQPDSKPEVKKLIMYLTNGGKSALGQINTPEELDAILNAVWEGMNDTMKRNSKAIAIKKVIDLKL